MKKLFSILIVFCSFRATAQFSIHPTDARLICYDSAIKITLQPKFGLERQATFTGFAYNLETNQLTISWKITYSKSGQPVFLFGRESEIKYQTADNSTFVNLSGEILSDTTGQPGPFMTEIDFYKMVAQRGTGANNATINQLIISAGSRPGKWKD